MMSFLMTSGPIKSGAAVADVETAASNTIIVNLLKL